jgi:hypothetical protein
VKKIEKLERWRLRVESCGAEVESCVRLNVIG